MNLDSDDKRITAYVLGELPADECAEFEAEIQSSSQLREAVEETRRVLALLSEEMGAEPQLQMSAEQRNRIRQAKIQSAVSESATPRSRPARWSRRARWGALVAVSATVLAILAGSYEAVQNSRQSARQLASRHEATRAALDARHAEEQARNEAAASLYAANARLAAEQAGQAGEQARKEATVLLSQTYEAPLLAGPGAPVRLLADGSFSPDGKHIVIRSADANALLWDASDSMPALSEGVPANEAARPDRGRGAGEGGDRYAPIVENPFLEVRNEPLSTFSIDVDTASYSKVRMYLLQHQMMPRPDAVRIEELVNYFPYDYEPPSDGEPFAARVEVADCPWQPAHRLARIGIKGREVDRQQRPASNLVFLLDVSGSMKQPNKLPLVKSSMKMLVDQLGENDRIAIVVYAGAAGLVLESTTADQKQTIVAALDRLHAGGSTNGGEGIHLAYQTALDNFISGGVNRVILCSDGDFNVGVTGTDELVRLAEENARTGVFLSVLGFGMGNHNDEMLEQLSNKGNGNYAFIDTAAEARKVLVDQMSGTLVTIAKDVKIQVEFNPRQVAAYRLIGYEDRLLAAEDFNDDKKDAGEIGAGHTVTALYELIPAGGPAPAEIRAVDELRYQTQGELTDAAQNNELLTVKIRYKQPDGEMSVKREFPVKDEGLRFNGATRDFRFAASVAAFGMLLRDSAYKGDISYEAVLEMAGEGASGDPTGYRTEFLSLVDHARRLSGK